MADQWSSSGAFMLSAPRFTSGAEVLDLWNGLTRVEQGLLFMYIYAQHT